MKRSFLFLVFIGLCSKFLGFIRELVVSFYFGISDITDAFNIAQSISGFFLTFIGVAISVTFIPIYNRVSNEKGNAYAEGFFSSLIYITVLLSAFITWFIYFFSEFTVILFAPGLIGEAKLWAIELTEICSLGVGFFCATFLFTAYLNGRNCFKRAAFTTIPYNFILLFSVIYASENGIEFLGYGKLLASLVQVVMLLVFSWKLGARVSKFEIKYLHELKNILWLSVPAMLGAGVEQINRLVDKNIASTIMQGGVSIVNYAERIILLVEGVLITPIITIFFSKLSKKITGEGAKKTGELVLSMVNYVTIISFPISVLLSYHSSYIVSFIYERGAFSSSDTSYVASIVSIYSIAIFFNAIRQCFARFFFVSEDTKTPMWNAFIGMGANIILNVTLSYWFGLVGLAFATLISSILILLLMYFSFRREVTCSFGGIWSVLLKVVLSTSLAIIASELFRHVLFFDDLDFISFSLIIIVFSFFYFFMLVLTSVQEVSLFALRFLRFLRFNL
ncbi:murein biosynthesis integral membrane protein MurJ [Pseudoalteromonas maricaloris]|uniref:Murein biosynthesis integral membrane protein MurJ n=1 Tax=Pseudoalteromonas maricaloris TaxID=184924 RepID=A0A8I2H7D2_9GAMM|nr:murein biosynthesis integral membrane protein MurJ [Pseudoalteromonas maricaloris]NLR23402.1 murein biosynthesis integral membrane protein MurJ [Pseudoalteromonas maricaloris]WOX29218.1 murein biosynthesis integral membrane protein MurJ [Pseudoalteromonas maricaloris]